MLIRLELYSKGFINYVLSTYKKEAMFRIPNVSAIDKVKGLPLLRLLPIIIKDSSSRSLPCENRP